MGVWVGDLAFIPSSSPDLSITETLDNTFVALERRFDRVAQ